MYNSNVAAIDPSGNDPPSHYDLLRLVGGFFKIFKGSQTKTMASNSVTSFLARLLKPDKKIQKPDPRRRHSAPVPDWFDISEDLSATKNDLKSQKQKRKQKEKYSSQQNLTDMNKRKVTREKNVSIKNKRHSAVFPSWFCMSGNSDTIDRTALPISKKPNSNNRKEPHNHSKSKVNDPARIDVRKQDTKIKTKENKHSYSSPALECSTEKLQTKNGKKILLTNIENIDTQQTDRDLPPGVRYRFDGTLEKPYVFPAGLTFGPEGRKLQLRRTANSQVSEKTQNNIQPKETFVKADVHRSTEDIIMEYSYEESCPDHAEFDVRKAFYLKYDSNVSIAEDHAYRTDSLDPVRAREFENNMRNDGTNDSNRSLQRQVRENRWKPKDIQNDKVIHRNSKRQLRAERYKNRYSMPLTNEHYLYMGSFENLNMSSRELDKENQISKSSFDIYVDERNSRRDIKNANRKNRYSKPVRNNGLIYMGSFENVNQLLIGDKDRKIGFSLPGNKAETDVPMQSDFGNEMTSVREPSYSTECIKSKSNSSTVVDGNENSHLCLDNMDTSSGKTVKKPIHELEETSSFQDEHKRRSMPDLVFSTCLSTEKHNEDMTGSEHEDEKYDLFDSNSLFWGKTRSLYDTQFTRHIGRSSCMPGNKRSVAPPPSIKQPMLSQHSSETIFGSIFNRSSFMPGNKRFMIPPPPCYTPPKEDIDFDPLDIKCNRGSQTDLSMDFENLNMEDRDTSLKLTDVKTVFAGVPVGVAKPISIVAADVRNNDTLLQTTNVGMSTYSNNVQMTQTVLDVSDITQGSADVFIDNISSHSYYKTDVMPLTCLEVSSTGSQNMQANDVSKQLVSDGLHKIKHENTQCTPKNVQERNDSVSSCNNKSSASPAAATPRNQETHRLLANCQRDSIRKHQDQKPVPIPRKLYNTSISNETTELFASEIRNDTERTSKHNRTQPVPKQRHSLAYSKSLSAVGDHEQNFVLADAASVEDNRISNVKLVRTQSCDSCSTLQRKHNCELSNSDSCSTLQRKHNCELSNSSSNDATENVYEALSDEHIYEDIDNYDRIYEECGDAVLKHSLSKKSMDKDGTMSSQNLLLPLQNLEDSPGQQRRLRLNPESTTYNMTASQRQHYTSLAYSLDHLIDHRNHWRDTYEHFQFVKHDDNDDNSSIADDEMSMSNDEDAELGVKQYSLRKCISADNIFSIENIVNSSLMLAKKHRKRVRERRSRSQVSPHNNDLMHFKECFHLNANLDTVKNVNKLHYSKRKATSNERLFKQKYNHNDSGHDSETVSPCTSPDARRHLDKVTSMKNENSSLAVDDSSAARQGTLPKKPWEIRLRNTQYLRKSRSRENL